MVEKNKYQPALPFDMAQFRRITGGKGTFQDELLEIFFYNIEECIVVMRNDCVSNLCEKWYDATEELKNICDNIGALELAKICAVAHRASNQNVDQKQQIIKNIEEHTKKLKVFLRNTRY